MSASSVLLVAASIVAVEGGMATIDAGKTQLLEPGDRGQAFYELIVNGMTKHIEVGSIVVTTVGDGSAVVSNDSGVPLRPGYRVELHLPVDRTPELPVKRPPRDDLKRPVSEPLKPPVSAPLKRPVSAPAEPSEPGLSVPLRDQPPSPPQTEPVQPVPEDYPQLTLPPVPVEPDRRRERLAPPDPARDVISVPAGRYTIGLGPIEAQYFNQTPRHDIMLTAFSIDRYPVGEGLVPSLSGPPLTGLSFDDAQAHCQDLGLRLPSEQEWEVAAQAPGFVAEPGLLEWTASWYQAYPGNSRSEEEYGETSRVLRGFSDGSTETLFTRRFMSPNQRHSGVGFRCVGDPR